VLGEIHVGSATVEPKVSGTVENRVLHLLTQFADVFPEKLPNEPLPERAVDHRIDLVHGAQPVARPYYRLSYSELDELKLQLKPSRQGCCRRVSRVGRRMCYL
jgi:hypothetical protein